LYSGPQKPPVYRQLHARSYSFRAVGPRFQVRVENGSNGRLGAWRADLRLLTGEERGPLRCEDPGPPKPCWASAAWLLRSSRRC